MNMPTPLDRLPDDQDTLNKIKELPPAEDIPFKNVNSDASIDNTSDEDVTFRSSDRDWTRSAVSFLLIIFVVLLIIYYGIQNRPVSKDSSVPQVMMTENTDKKFKKLSDIMETLKQTEEEIEHILSE